MFETMTDSMVEVVSILALSFISLKKRFVEISIFRLSKPEAPLDSKSAVTACWV